MHTRFDEHTTASSSTAAHQRLGASERRDKRLSGEGPRPRARSENWPSASGGTQSSPDLHNERHAVSMSQWGLDHHPAPLEPRSERSGSKTRSGRHGPNPAEPQAPKDLPSLRAGGGCHTGEFGASGHGAPLRPRLYAPQLEALSHGASVPNYAAHADVEQTRLPPPSMHSPRASTVNDSQSSGSLTEVQELEEWEGLSDGSEDPDQSRQQGRQQALQQQIDQSKQAINRHRMTIEMLELAQHEEVHVHSGGAESSTHGFSCDEGGPIVRPPVVVPAVVQDSSARLLRRCLDGLGNEKFQAARRSLQMWVDAAEYPSSIRSRMIDLLGVEKIGFLSMLEQLVYMERRWGVQEYQYN